MTSQARFRTLAATLLGLALAGCGSTDNAQSVSAFLSDLTRSVRPDGAAAAPADLGLTRAALAGFTTPLQLVTLEPSGVSAVMGPLGSNNGADTWSSADNRTISYRQGIVVATRGLSGDLMSASVPTLGQIAAGSGTHSRVHFYLNGLDQTERQDFRCTLSSAGSETLTIVGLGYPTRRIDEDCSGAAGSFRNSYWIEGGTYLRQSRQYVAKEAGFLVTKRLVD
ncbi:YjbF family lipoprotein [Fertoebacter nigrum]|uniref:YjbF family lipoprotein n=1 Tax=Fertoeibacter niger TaxID=2656921 RepID=A0A8X8H379_9RHOB|nr:YjbF family lipoprotein [Fertoeibacter niger]NUB45392.1 YjbF family lipoprotein [Fertoeibacter niger]